MKSFEIKTLVFLAAVSCLPIACGTTSVSGPDALALSGPERSVTAMRSVDPLPPTAPLPPSADTAPLPSDVNVPTPNDVNVPTSNDVNVPPTSNDGTVPTSNDVNAPEAPNSGSAPRTGQNQPPPAPTSAPTPEPDSDTNPVPPTSVPESDPKPPTSSPVPVPLPVSVACLAESIEIVETAVFASTPGVSLVAMLADAKGNAITDGSCEKLVWTIERSGGADSGFALPQITYGDTTRTVTYSAGTGTYKVGVVAPNGVNSSRLVTF